MTIYSYKNALQNTSTLALVTLLVACGKPAMSPSASDTSAAVSMSKDGYAGEAAEATASADMAAPVASMSKAETAESIMPEKPHTSDIQANAGVVTAGEWNDLKNWDYWQNLLDTDEFKNKPDHWQFYPKHRISISVKNGNSPVVDAKVTLHNRQDKQSHRVPVWTSRTDNLGNVELWIGLYHNPQQVNFKDYWVSVNGKAIGLELKHADQGVNTIQLNENSNNNNKKPSNVDIAFIVDATGSMGDEISFLKRDLQSVIKQVEQQDDTLNIKTSAVFYRDHDDQYLVKKSSFTSRLGKTLNFIKEQNADGGGDFPEAVEVALDTAINKLQWSDKARTRIAFLLLDAPPHHTPQIIDTLQDRVKQAAEKGIKIIPITASGIDKDTEFLMRFMAMSTNGTYTFITDHSGVGNPHLVASVGQYDVEKLNALMVRLIKKYSS